MPDPLIHAPKAGFVAPTNLNNEFDEPFLHRFLNGLVSGIVTPIASMNVRPRWQQEPGNQPDINTDWCAIGTVRRPRDVFAAELMEGSGNNLFTRVVTNEILEILASFYGPNSDANAQLFTMGLDLAQNREALLLNGFGLIEVQDPRTVPALIKERWMYGVDVPFRMRRQQIYDYPTADILIADGTLTFDDFRPVLTVPFRTREG